MIYLLLGTNMGDRQWNLEQAKALLSEALRCDLVCSDIMETEAVGFSGGDFLNQIVAFKKDIRPLDLLDLCQNTEIALGRPRHEAVYDKEGKRIYSDRIIDIDILMFNDLQLESERLTLPHPQVEERPFVKEILKTMIL